MQIVYTRHKIKNGVHKVSARVIPGRSNARQRASQGLGEHMHLTVVGMILASHSKLSHMAGMRNCDVVMAWLLHKQEVCHEVMEICRYVHI